MKTIALIFCLFALSFNLSLCVSKAYADYPQSWWTVVPESQAESWEILPQAAKPGEVILSKRTELGVFSNLAKAPFNLDNNQYASIEAFWQMMKYPDLNDPEDTRREWIKDYPYTREQVKMLSDFEAKKAGDAANKVMKEHGFTWISYQNKKFNYKDFATGSAYHYDLIYRVTVAKIEQNPAIKKLLVQTGDLILRPDHNTPPGSPKSYYYFDILMDIRAKLK